MIGSYEVGELVGKGGTSLVWRASHPDFAEPIALKVLTGRSAHEVKFREYLANEMRAVARLHHPGIARIVDSGVVDERAARAHNLVEDAPFIAMEFVSGRTLEGVLDELDWDAVEGILRSLLDSLAHAHALGVIHLDIKPGNVLLREEGSSVSPVLTDFGIAQTDTSQVQRDEVTSVTGTPNYMAPEQIQGDWRDVGPWTDLYSLGCMAFRMITGRAPFDGPSTYAILHGHLLEPIPGIVPRMGVPRAVVGWLQTMLQKSPVDRFQRAAHAAWALHRLDRNDWIDGVDERPGLQIEEPTFIVPALDLAREPARRAIPRWKAPPLPIDWRRRRMPRRDASGVGLSMVRHLRPSIVNYDELRDQIWASLESALNSGFQAVELCGPGGSGTSHLAMWCASLAEEVGAASSMVARYRARQSMSPLESALAREFGVTGMASSKALPRVRDRLAASEGFDEGDLLDSVLLTDLLVESSSKIVNEEERHGVLCRAIARIAKQKPLILILDDLHHAPEDAGIVADLMSLHSESPVLVIVTTHEPLDWQYGITRLELGKLSESHLHEVVRQLVDLDDDALQLVADVASGRPGTAVTLVTSWAERGILVRGPDGYGISEVSTLESASEAETHAAIEILSSFHLDEQKALVTAALLGMDFAVLEWRQITEQLGLSLADDFVERAIRQGLVGRELAVDRATYEFTGEELHHGVIAHGRSAGWNETISGACADHLLQNDRGSRSPVILERVGRHLFEAGRADEALETIGLAAVRFHHQDMARAAERLVAKHAEIQPHASEQVRRAERPLARAADLWIRHTQGRAIQADEAADVQREAYAAEHWLALAEAARLRAKILRGQSFEASNEVLEEAAAILVDRDERTGLGTFWLGIGWNRGLQGDFAIAYPHLDRAEQVFREEGDRHWLCQTWRARSYLMIQEGDLAGARRMLDHATEVARGSGDRMNVGGSFLYLGEIARAEGEYAEAARHYSKALEVYTLDGSNNVAVTRFNLALCEIARGRFVQAHLILEDLQDTGAASRAKITDYVGLAFGPIFAARRNWREWDQSFVPAVKTVRRKLHSENDFAWLCEIAGNIAEDSGKHERARFAWQMSAELWSALGRENDAKRLRNRLKEGI